MRYLILLCLFVGAAHAQNIYTNDSQGWLNNGARISNSENRKTINGFGAALIVTSDKDWQRKWETPSATIPIFTEVRNLKRGARATMLITFANPLPDKNSEVDITCDIKIIRPNGKVTKNLDMKAMKTKLLGKASDTYLAEPVIEFAGGDNEPLGIWRVEVVVHDKNRKVSVPVKTKFTLVQK